MTLAIVLMSAPALAGPIVTDELGGSSDSDIADWSYKTNVIEVVATARLVTISPRIRYAPATGDDLLQFVLYEETTQNDWDLVWNSPLVAVGINNGFKDSPEIDVILEAGKRYALGWYMPDGNYEYWFDDPAAQVDLGWAVFAGSVWSAENTTYTLQSDINNFSPDDHGYLMRLTVELLDVDGDGSLETEDCDDEDPTTYPGAPELCDGIDNDCTGVPDDPVDHLWWFEDADGDGFGNSANARDLCDGSSPIAGWVDNDGDCDDTDGFVHPDALEVCDGVDNDCDALVDDNDDDVDLSELATWFEDRDGDGFGNAAVALEACSAPGFVTDDTDCDDDNAARFPGNPEICDGFDNDCDGSVVDEDDDDGDGSFSCEDCDDADPATWPGAPEICDGIDHDCDGVIPERLDCDPAPGEALKIATCGCRTPGLAPGWLALAAALVIGRRRRDLR